MGRRRSNFVPEHNETLSQETPKVQAKIINELFGKSEDVPDIKVETVDTSELESTSVDFKVGDNVKLNKDVKFDLLGKRIHEGLRNYKYRILSVRVDGMLIIECLTHCFTVKPEDVTKI